MPRRNKTHFDRIEAEYRNVRGKCYRLGGDVPNELLEAILLLGEAIDKFAKRKVWKETL